MRMKWWLRRRTTQQIRVLRRAVVFVLVLNFVVVGVVLSIYFCLELKIRFKISKEKYGICGLNRAVRL